MSYSYAYLGWADLDDETLSRWLATSLDAVDLDALRTLSWGLEPSTIFADVGDVLNDVARWRGAFLEIGTRTRMRVVATKDRDEWLTYRGDVAFAFAALHTVGGDGRLEVVGYDDGGPDGGYRIVASPTGLFATELGEDDVGQVRSRHEYGLLRRPI